MRSPISVGRAGAQTHVTFALGRSPYNDFCDFYQKIFLGMPRGVQRPKNWFERFISGKAFRA
ncbi:MAG: hypothetical protein WBA57_00445 [Elainellaceae cyanobacterium]